MERERAVRFSNHEIEILVNLVKTHIIVEEKRLNCTTNAGKRKAWEKITSEFLEKTSSNRTEFQLLKKWKNLKHSARKYEAAINNKEQCVPGRGPPPRSPILEEVLEVIRREQDAFINASDNNINMGLFTHIKVEKEENCGPTNPLFSDGSTNWEQEQEVCTASPEEDPIGAASFTHHMEVPEETSFPQRDQNHFEIIAERSCSSSIQRSPEIVEYEEDTSDDIISVGGSIAPPTSLRSGADKPELNIVHHNISSHNSTEVSKWTQLVQEKELAMKSAQLLLLEKENKIKDLDIQIRQEQLTDIMLRRKREQELHELRKRRMLQGLHS